MTKPRLSMKLLRKFNNKYRAETTMEKTQTIDIFLDFVEEQMKSKVTK